MFPRSGIVSAAPVPRIEINGQAATAGQLEDPELVNDGQFTLTRVYAGRCGSVRRARPPGGGPRYPGGPGTRP
jgi:hypothetical protein